PAGITVPGAGELSGCTGQVSREARPGWCCYTGAHIPPGSSWAGFSFAAAGRWGLGRLPPGADQGGRRQPGEFGAVPGQVRLVGVTSVRGHLGQLGRAATVDAGYEAAEPQHPAQQHRTVTDRGAAAPVQLPFADPE